MARDDDVAAARLFADAPTPWSTELSVDGLHVLVDANGKLVARSPMLGWLEAIAAIVNEYAGQAATVPPATRGTIHELDAGRYRAVIRHGVPAIEREDTAGAVAAVQIPCSPEVVTELTASWSPPVQLRIEDGELVLRRVE